MSQPAPEPPRDVPREVPAPTIGSGPAAPGGKDVVRLPVSAQQLRRARARRLAIRFAVFTGMPTLLAILYFGLLASPQYDSTAIIAVESSRGRDETGTDAKGAGNHRDARLLRDYIRSRTMLDHLVADHGFREHYQDGGRDWYSRLAADADQDDLHAYFRDKVAVTREHDANVLAVRVRAFAPDRAQAMARAVLDRAERWVTELSARSRQELIAPAEAAVGTAREHLATARSGTDTIQLEVAQEELEAALAGLQAAQLEAARNQRYVVVVAAPSLPDAAARPRPLWDIATVMITALVLTSVLSLLGAAVREHANF